MSDQPQASRFLIYWAEDGAIKIEVRFEDETVWLSQPLMAELFGATQQNVSLHLQNIYEEGELQPAATHKEYLSVRREGARDVRCSDFLECSAEQLGGLFDRVVMNPPFAACADIKHINHALAMLKPGGRLVALCANGPRQNAALRALVDARGGDWEDLPADSFKAEGTGVSVALITLHA